MKKKAAAPQRPILKATIPERTNQYCVTGLYQLSSLDINQPKKTEVYNVAVTITGIRNNTPAIDLLAAIKREADASIREQVPNITALNISNVSLLDSFETMVTE